MGVGPSDVTPWNADPWYINAAPSGAQPNVGLDPLFRVLELMSRPTVLLLQGGHAQTTGRKFEKGSPGYLDARGINVVTTYHRGRQALWHKDSDAPESPRRPTAGVWACSGFALIGGDYSSMEVAPMMRSHGFAQACIPSSCSAASMTPQTSSVSAERSWPASARSSCRSSSSPLVKPRLYAGASR